MFNRKQAEDHPLEEEIDRLLEDMKTADRTSKEYVTMTDQLGKLYALRPKRVERHVSPDTLAIVGGNLAGVLAIVMAEKSSVISQKALSFIAKVR